jgi:ribonucleoside-diphosphate reductase subunit M1
MIHLMEDTLKIRSRDGKISYWSRDKLHDDLVKVCQAIECSDCNIDESFCELKLPIREIVEYTEKQLSSTTSIDELNMILTDYCSSMVTSDISYGFLSSRLIHIHHHLNTIPSFSQAMTILWKNGGSVKPVIGESFFNDVMENAEFLDNVIDHARDNLIDYFGFKTLERAYLLKSNGKIIERVQHLWMRVAVGLHKKDKDAIVRTYDLLSLKYFVHATPTLFNIGTPNPQMSSCYLVALEDDSINGIFNTISECASISKWAGGIGLHIHNIRGAGAPINGTNGTSNGIVPMLRVFNATARYVDQGGGRRNGSIAIYMEPWHSDIYEWVDMKRNQGDDELRARDLFYALWVPDLFMSRVDADQEWSLFSSDSAPGLSDVYGYKFKELYEKYEEEGRAYKKVKARELWMKILDSQMETGTPYILYKDAANTKSNQKNLGVIKSSNLCTEIMEYSDKDETAVCNLASISLPNFVTYPKFTSEPTVYTKQGCVWCDRLKILFKRRKISYKEINVADKDIPFIKCKLGIKTFPRVYLSDVEIGGYTECETHIEPIFDFEKLESVVHVIVDNLNKIIDDNLYPTPKCKRSNFSHRPIGVGIQGLADVFLMMDMAFDSERANILNTKISATIYYAALEMSCKLSERRGRAMKTLMKTETIETLFVDPSDPVSKLYRIDDNDARTNLINVCCPTVAEYTAAMRGSPPGAYSTFDGSPISNGMLQFDMWGVSPDERYDWSSLKQRIKRYGIRNSLLVAPMPTASTSQILGNNECFEPFTSNIYTRRTLSGEYIMVNKHLVKELVAHGMWSDDIKDSIIKYNGSVQHIDTIPKAVRDKYKTAWELSMKTIIDMSASRGAYICQSQSLNVWMESPTYRTLTSMHFYSWRAGLKTGMYYLRRKPRHQVQQFTIVPESEKEESCEMCSA